MAFTDIVDRVRQEFPAEERRDPFDVGQENLQPFLDLGNQQLPALEQGASVGGFFDDPNALRPLVSEINQPIIDDRLRDLNTQLGQTGLTRSGFAAQAAADIQEDADLSLLLQLQEMFSGRRQQVAGVGGQAGTTLGRLGQQSAEQLSGIRSREQLADITGKAQQTQNLLGLAGLGIEFANRPGGVDIIQPNLDQPNPDGSFDITPVRN